MEKKDESNGGIVAYLDSIKPKLQEAATVHLDPDRLIRVFLGEAQRTPKLLQCDMSTIVAALSLCNQTGLEPGGTMGHAYLIPRRNNKTGKTECQFQLGYKGLAELARRSGEIARVNAAPVFQHEIDAGLFEYSHEPPEIRHSWTSDAPADPDPKTIVGAYAVVELRDGQRVQVWLSRAQIEKRRKVAAAKSGPWQQWYAEMCRKTALRAVLNGGLVPISVEMRTAMDADVDDWTQPPGRRETRITRSQRSAQVFQEAIAPSEPSEPEVIEAQAEPTDEPTAKPAGGPYAAEWDALVEQYAASETQATRSLKAAGLHAPPTDPDQLHDAHVALEREVGA
jgi:recombination protein RecT